MILALLAGCTQTQRRRGTPLTRADVAKIAPSASKAEVLTALGPPGTIETVPRGSRFRYRFVRDEGDQLHLSFMQAAFSYDRDDERTAEVWVRFDRQGRVTELSWPRAGR